MQVLLLKDFRLIRILEFFLVLHYGLQDLLNFSITIRSTLDSFLVCGQSFYRIMSHLFSQEGTAMLLEHLAGSLASAIPVSTQLDIAAQHHLFMMGRNGSNIKHIMQRTGAQIHFPDPSNPQKKSTVYLQGTIESVCLARQYLMVGLLKLVLLFHFILLHLLLSVQYMLVHTPYY